MNALWAPLRLSGFRRLFAGQALSDFANWSDFLALSAIVVYVWGYGAFELALLSICIGLPYVVVGPLAGLRIGRLDPRAVLVVCDLLRGIVVFGLLWAPSLAWLLLLVFLKMCASAVFDPVRQSAIKRFVPPSGLAEASALSHMTVNATKIVAPMAGGALIALHGPFAPFWLGAALYLLSAAVLLGLPRSAPAALAAPSGDPDAPPPGAGTSRFIEEMRAALRYVRSRRTLGFGIAYTGAMMFLLFLYDGLFVLFTARLGLGEASLGVLMSGIGGGSVLGALAAGRWTFWKADPLRLMSRVGVLSGLMIALVGVGAYGLLPTSMWFWAPCFAAMGFVGAFGSVPFGYLLQTETTEATVAPVSAFANALQTGSMLAAPMLGAALAAWIGVGGVFLAAGAAMSAFAAAIGLKLAGRREAGAVSRS
ncbi:MFS transporter [Paenibacillus sp.]|uniref:MFS transporter n=1 Tax=Paenibacillus sp. TaxID=58172 RepID=UPI002D3217E5|nr:MFS transporter [Paenibacillus sp.]HZG56281.1 MFS transporter [Paenibacillus sp.]